MNKLIIITFLLVPLTSFALDEKPYQTPTPYNLLAPIPLNGPGGVTNSTTAKDYIPGIIRLTIMLAGAFAVIRIMWGGFQYISTDAFSGKSNAKGIITNALWGLVLAMSAYLILYTLNPKLVEIDLSINKYAQLPTSTTPLSGSITIGPPPAGGLQQSTTNAIAGLRQ